MLAHVLLEGGQMVEGAAQLVLQVLVAWVLLGLVHGAAGQVVLVGAEVWGCLRAGLAGWALQVRHGVARA